MTILIFGFGVYVVKKLAYTTLLERLTQSQHITEGVGDSSSISRVAIIKEGIWIGITHPIAGVGLDNLMVNNVMGIYAHDNYAEILADTGFIGFILYYGIYICIILKLLKLRKTIKSPMLKMIMIYILFDMLIWQIFGVTYAQKETWILLGVVVGYLNNCSQDQNNLDTVQSDDSY